MVDNNDDQANSDDQGGGVFWFTAASGFQAGKTQNFFQFQTKSQQLGEVTLGFRAKGDDGDLALDPNGEIDPNTEVTLDGGETWQEFKTIASGEVKGTPSLSQSNGGAFEGRDPDEPLIATVIEVDGEQFVLFPDEPEASGKVPGLIRIDDDGNIVFVCFAEGTLIMTDRGDVAVEDLRVGDRVLTRDHGYQPLRWIGGGEVERNPASAPIRISAGALGAGAPVRDLLVSPQHRVMVTGGQLEASFGFDEALVPARHLVNGDTITQELDGDTVVYFHLLFDQHEVIYSEGLPTESFHPGSWGLNTLDEAARAEVIALFPQLDRDEDAYGPSARPSLKRHEAMLIAG